MIFGVGPKRGVCNYCTLCHSDGKENYFVHNERWSEWNLVSEVKCCLSVIIQNLIIETDARFFFFVHMVC